MTDESTPLRKIVDRTGYAFNMAVEDVIRRSFESKQQKWECVAPEQPWESRAGDERGFIDLVIRRDRAVGIIECKKVNNGDKLLFLTRRDQKESETRCRLEVYLEHLPYEANPSGEALSRMDDRFRTDECDMVTGSPESAYCATSKDGADLNLDRMASGLLRSCEGALNDWWIEMDDTVCVPIIVTNATIYTCAFDPTQIDLNDGNLPASAQFKPHPFVRFRKAFKQTAGINPHPAPLLEARGYDGERTVFVVEARHLVPFLQGLRKLYRPVSGGLRLMVTDD